MIMSPMTLSGFLTVALTPGRQTVKQIVACGGTQTGE